MKLVVPIVAIFLFCFFLFIVFNFDKDFFVTFDETTSHLLLGNEFINAFHVIGDTPVIVGIGMILLVVLWLKEQNYRGMLFVLLTIGIGRVLNQLIKSWLERPRPEMANQLTSFSLPSGHAMLSLLYLFTIAYLLSEVIADYKKRTLIWIVAALLSLFTGLSRISQNHHYATDVVAGWSIAFVWFVLCMYWYERRKKKFQLMKRHSD